MRFAAPPPRLQWEGARTAVSVCRQARSLRAGERRGSGGVQHWASGRWTLLLVVSLRARATIHRRRPQSPASAPGHPSSNRAPMVPRSACRLPQPAAQVPEPQAEVLRWSGNATCPCASSHDESPGVTDSRAPAGFPLRERGDSEVLRGGLTEALRWLGGAPRAPAPSLQSRERRAAVRRGRNSRRFARVPRTWRAAGPSRLRIFEKHKPISQPAKPRSRREVRFVEFAARTRRPPRTQ